MKNLVFMIQFFTTIPIKINLSVEEKDFPKGLMFFPFIGLIIGIFNYLIYYIFSFLNIELLSFVSCLLANIVITGALHIDGLADTCDGLLSSRSKERMLEIMKDSRIGTNGVIAIIIDLILRLVLLLSLADNLIFPVIVLGPVLGKSFLLFLILTSPCAREKGLSSLFYSDFSRLHIMIGFTTSILMIVFIHSWKMLTVLIPCFLVILLYRCFVNKKIEGMTGDTLGAANEIIEIAFLLFIIIFERFGLL